MTNSIGHGWETLKAVKDGTGITEVAFESPDDRGVRRFAEAMRTKLDQKRHEGRGGWNDREAVTAEQLSEMLRRHVEKGDPVDVANFCMMLHQRGERII